MSIEEFKNYSSSSETITIYYKLDKHFSNYQEGRDISLNTQADEFISIIDKDYFSGYETFKKSDTLNEVKKRISEKSGFPIETMIGFGKYGG